jgi:hypothetical protein
MSILLRKAHLLDHSVLPPTNFAGRCTSIPVAAQILAVDVEHQTSHSYIGLGRKVYRPVGKRHHPRAVDLAFYQVGKARLRSLSAKPSVFYPGFYLNVIGHIKASIDPKPPALPVA